MKPILNAQIRDELGICVLLHNIFRQQKKGILIG
jgi:hypothetical protein